jgi:demethylmenaquinone methyltransferase/2-methoxy-6-polyprenyl-1,4-benzoquinol methylase
MHDLTKYGLLAIQEETLAAETERSALVRDRYDKLAPYVTLIDHLLMMSSFRVRERAIKCLPLGPGDTVVELGCGTGRNFPYLRNAVERSGCVIGVEFSPGMLARACKLAEQETLDIELVEQDVARYALPPADLVLLALCYHTLEYPAQTLARIWEALKPGACLAIMDGKPPDILDKVVRPFGARVLESIFMGDAKLRPWENLARLGNIQMKKFLLGAHYVCWAIKQ